LNQKKRAQLIMNKEINFWKMHGAGNDFIVIDGRKTQIDENILPDLAKNMCDRHFGIGADGILLVLPSEKADCRMKMLNPDGSEAEMCGNGIRCFAKYIYDTSNEKKDVLSVETLAGIMVPALIIRNGQAVGAEVDMGTPKENKKSDLKIGDKIFKITIVSMGNPHCVVFVDDINNVNLTEIGPKIENHKMFPNRTNVEFVQVLGDKEIKVIVWERGAGITLACGTGACASLVAAHLNNKTSRRAIVHLPGGDLDVEWEKEDDHVALRGPAEKVFEGKFLIN